MTLSMSPISRKTYALWGFGLFFIKYNLDRVIAFLWHQKLWYPWDYWGPGISTVEEYNKDPYFFITLGALALPFIAVGTWLTLRRLKDAQLPLPLVLLFFVPFANILFLISMCLIPGRKVPSNNEPAHNSFLQRILPHSQWGCISLSVLITGVTAAIIAVFSTNFLEHYGWTLFCGVPFFQGMLSVLLAGAHQRVSYGMATLLAVGSVALTGALIFFLAFEGIICLVMAAPIAFVIAQIGATIGFFAQCDALAPERIHGHVAPVLLLPLLMMWENHADQDAPLIEAVTRVEIAAPAETVWKHVVTFSDLPPVERWIFKTGIAYPTHATIEGTGVGAVRRCEFSTGAFIEPITTWDEPRLLAFRVEEQPPPMFELSFHNHLHTPHLNNYLQSHRGQFLLTRLENGGTRLEGTTWYENKMWPQLYWKLWSDWLIHTIHLRVLEHIKIEAESEHLTHAVTRPSGE